MSADSESTPKSGGMGFLKSIMNNSGRISAVLVTIMVVCYGAVMMANPGGSSPPEKTQKLSKLWGAPKNYTGDENTDSPDENVDKKRRERNGVAIGLGVGCTLAMIPLILFCLKSFRTELRHGGKHHAALFAIKIIVILVGYVGMVVLPLMSYAKYGVGIGESPPRTLSPAANAEAIAKNWFILIFNVFIIVLCVGYLLPILKRMGGSLIGAAQRVGTAAKDAVYETGVYGKTAMEERRGRRALEDAKRSYGWGRKRANATLETPAEYEARSVLDYQKSTGALLAGCLLMASIADVANLFVPDMVKDQDVEMSV